MYGLIVKLTAAPGKRDEFIAILKECAGGMPGCLSYIVAEDPEDESVISVTEAWDSMASHDASLALPSVQDAIARAKPIVSSFERIAATTPVWGVGLRSAEAY
jgi:quinol monooxygenase YgiN